MEIEKVFLSNNNESLRRDLVLRLQAGAVMMLPTDTIYGLSCRADQERAIAKIFAIKRRDYNKPLLVLVSSVSMAKRFCLINRRQEIILKKIWNQKRPTSVLLAHRGLLPSNLTAKSDWLAVRLPKSIFLRKIIRSLGAPLVSTSANFSGENLLTASAALKCFNQEPRPDLVVVGGRNYKKASRLIKLEANGAIEVLRN